MGMIQEIAPHQFHNEYQNTNIKKEDILLVYHEGMCLIRQQEEIGFFAYEELEELVSHKQDQFCYAFAIDEERYFIWEADEKTYRSFKDSPWREKGRFEKQQIFRRSAPQYRCFAGVTGGQLNRWYQNEVFCSRCQTKLVRHKTERAMQCPACQKLRYPVISPCVIVAVTQGERILLTRYASGHSTYKKYALIAGFAEIGESIEKTVQREVMEEVGLKVKNLRFYKSQPWSFTDTLLFGFFAELDGEEEITMDEKELSEAGWFLREELPEEFDGVSLTNEMIRVFRDGS